MSFNKLIYICFSLSIWLTPSLRAEILTGDDGNKYITLGSTKDEVLEVLGTPSRIEHYLSECWYYGLESIKFDYNGTVKTYTNAKRLKVLLLPSKKSHISEALNSKSTEGIANESIPSSGYSSTTNNNSSSSSYPTSSYGEISELTGRPKTVSVKGYYRRDGTYVKPHYRSSPRR